MSHHFAGVKNNVTEAYFLLVAHCVANYQISALETSICLKLVFLLVGFKGNRFHCWISFVHFQGMEGKDSETPLPVAWFSTLVSHNMCVLQSTQVSKLGSSHPPNFFCLTTKNNLFSAPCNSPNILHFSPGPDLRAAPNQRGFRLGSPARRAARRSRAGVSRGGPRTWPRWCRVSARCSGWPTSGGSTPGPSEGKKPAVLGRCIFGRRFMELLSGGGKNAIHFQWSNSFL